MSGIVDETTLAKVEEDPVEEEKTPEVDGKQELLFPEPEQKEKTREDLADELISEIYAPPERSKYTIEFVCNKTRSTTQPFVGILSFWKGTNFLDGCCDEGIYLCPDCMRPILEDGLCAGVPFGKHANSAICHTCGKQQPGDKLVNTITERLSHSTWAKHIYHYFMLFEQDCDIYFKFFKQSIRENYENWRSNTKAREAPLLDKYVLGQQDKELALYRKESLIKDTLAGADPIKRIEVFICGGG